MEHLENGRNWYRALQHHFEERSSIENVLSKEITDALENMELDEHIKRTYKKGNSKKRNSKRTLEATQGISLQELSTPSVVSSAISAISTSSKSSKPSTPFKLSPSSEPSSATVTNESSSTASSPHHRSRRSSLHVVTGAATTNTHVQLYHSLKMSYTSWSHGLLESSVDLSSLAVRVRHLKRELKGTVGMLQKRSDDLNKQLKKALYAPRRALSKLKELENKLESLEQRYKSTKKRSRNKGISSSGISSVTKLENAVLSLRDKTEAAKARVVHVETEARVMRQKHTKCVQQMMQLTETKFIHLYNEMKAVSETYIRNHLKYVNTLEQHNHLLSTTLLEFDHVSR